MPVERAADRVWLARNHGHKDVRGSVRRPAVLLLLQRIEAKPKRRENFACEDFNFFRNALTSTSSGTCTTKPEVILPVTMPWTSLAALINLFPNLDLTLRSLPVLPNHLH
jgi:hypothetical protein